MRRSQFLKVMGVLLVPGMLVLLAPRVWADAGLPGDVQAETTAPALAGSCTITRVNFVTKETLATTTSSAAYTNIPELTVPFTMAGTTRSCVKVEFAAMVFAGNQPGNLMRVRARLDGVTIGSPTDVQLTGDDDEDNDGRWARSHAMNFAFNNVAPGPHTISIQFQSFSGGPVFVHKASVFVHHR